MLLSRVADALYWISRYLERAEHTARLIDVRLDLGLDRTADRRLGLRSALREPAAHAAGRAVAASPRRSSTRSIFDLANRDSVAACVTAARENARQVREEISSDMWEQLNGLFLRLQRGARRRHAGRRRPHYLCRDWSSRACICSRASPTRRWGTARAGSTCRSGRFLERADATAALLDLHFTDVGRAAPARTADHAEWVGLLRSCSALEAYCRCYTADLRPERIAEFLLLNPEFPRSVRFAAAARRVGAARASRS